MTQAIAEHADFANRILNPVRTVLGGQSLSNWLEGEAEQISRLGRARTHVVLNNAVRDALKINSIRRQDYGARAASSSGPQDHSGWTGSISLSGAGHSVSVLRAKSLQEI